MRSLLPIVPLLASSAAAAAIFSAASPAVTAAASGNPFSGYQPYVNSYYASEVSASALPSMAGAAKAAASAAAQVPSFSGCEFLALALYTPSGNAKIAL